MKIIYNNGDVSLDTVGVLKFINEFTKSLGVENVVINDDLLVSILRGMQIDFPHIDGLEKASVFKQLANFVTFFISERPILTPFQATAVGSEIAKIPNHQNTMVAFQIALANLHKSCIQNGDGETLTIENPVLLSKHSYIDILDALHDATPSTHFKMVTVLLEQLAYKNNPEAQYQTFNPIKL